MSKVERVTLGHPFFVRYGSDQIRKEYMLL